MFLLTSNLANVFMYSEYNSGVGISFANYVHVQENKCLTTAQSTVIALSSVMNEIFHHKIYARLDPDSTSIC